jgi:CheY-like chemotaxis protein
MPRALIVDDELDSARLLAAIVGLRQYETRLASTGQEAISAVATEPFDVILLDLMLPDLTGYEVARRLKSDRATASIPIVIVSARLAADNLPRGFLHGATDYVPKPFHPEWIFHALERARDWSVNLVTRPRTGRIRLNDEARNFYHDLSWLRSVLIHEGEADWDKCTLLLEDLIRWRIRHEALAQRNAQESLWVAEFSLEDDGLRVEFPDHGPSDRGQPALELSWRRNAAGAGWRLDFPLESLKDQTG